MQTGVTRSKYMLARIRDILGLRDESVIGNDQIFAIATEMSRDIAESFLCVESNFNLSVVASTATYDLTSSGGNPTGFFRLKLFAAPTGDNIITVEVDKVEIDRLKRFSYATTGVVEWSFNIWNGTLEFFPTPTSSGTWVVHFYKSPTTVISKTVAPETPSTFDTAIIYSTVAELAPIVGKPELASVYMELGSAQRLRGLEGWRSTRTESNQITYYDI